MKLLKSQEDWSKKYTSDDAKNLQDLIYGSPKEALDEAELMVSEIPVKYSKGIRPMIRKLETDEDERILRDELYRKSLKAKGLYDENAKIFKQPGKLSVNTWLNNTEFFNKLERDYGVKTGMLVNDSVEASNIAHKYLNDKYLKYDKFLDEVDKSGLSEKVGKMLRGEIKPQTPQEIDYFTRGRALFDEGREDAIKFGANVKYLQNYFPDRTVIPIATSSDSGLRFGIKDKKLAIEQEKTNSMNKALLNNDFVKAARQMHLENSTIPLVKKILPQYIDSVQQLRALGLSSDAKRVEDTFMAGMGFNKDERNKIFADEVMRLNEKDLKQMLVKLSIKEKDLSATVYNELMSSMYKSWLGLSPKTLIVQGMQNGLTTAAEVGYGSLARARKFRMQADGKKLLNEVKDRLYNTSTDYLEKIEGHTNMLDPKSGLGKTKKVIDAVSIPGMAVFRKLDDLNREQAFLAGYLNVKKNGFNSDTMGHLLTGQRRHVLDTLKEKGAEEASREYGIIISHRNNYLYENWDKPEILRGKLGYLLPFTTWGRNQWMRFYGDLTQKDLEGKGLKMAIKRIALPTGMVMAVNALTGYDISSANPLTGLPSIGKLALMPSVMQPLETFAKGEPGRAAQQLMTAVPAGNLIYKMGIKEKTGDPVTDILGFRRRE
jgi:hypothetical protein